jgi:vancomycin permeability regulator SanA
MTGRAKNCIHIVLPKLLWCSILPSFSNMKKVLRYIFSILLLWFVAHCTYIITDGLFDEDTVADVAVILGSTVNEDGSISPRLKARLDKGYDLYRTGKVNKLMVSGGTGKEGYPEGTVMAAYLEVMGVNRQDIIIDDEGNNTYLTALHYKEAAAQQGFQSVIVVSQYFHITRCKMVFRKLGITNLSGAHAEYFELRDLYSAAREFVGFMFIGGGIKAIIEPFTYINLARKLNPYP